MIAGLGIIAIFVFGLVGIVLAWRHAGLPDVAAQEEYAQRLAAMNAAVKNARRLIGKELLPAMTRLGEATRRVVDAVAAFANKYGGNEHETQGW